MTGALVHTDLPGRRRAVAALLATASLIAHPARCAAALPPAGRAPDLAPRQPQLHCPPAYEGPGPYGTSAQPLQVVGAAAYGGLSATLTTPAGSSSGLPLVIFSPGFLVASSAYDSYHQQLASWGFPVASYDASDTSALDPESDEAGAARVLAVAAAAAARLAAASGDAPAAGASPGGGRPLYLIGHSRGAKLSVLAAAAAAEAGGAPSGSTSSSVAALALIDPVDLTYDSPPGAPSCLPALASSSAPVAVVGAGGNGDCVPRASAYPAFWQAATAGDGAPGSQPAAGRQALLAVAHDAGHLAFLNRLTTLQESVCRLGRADRGVLSQVTGGLLVAWGLRAAGQGGGAPDAWLQALPGRASERGLALDATPGPGLLLQ